MPKRLLERGRPDSVVEFRAAAVHRFEDATELAGRGRRTGAIYLWGYSIEMTLKASYFSFLGMPESQTLSWPGDLLPAITRGIALGIHWPQAGKGHNVRAWSELLVQERAVSANPLPLAVAERVERHGQEVEQLWRETLRYRKNLAYLYEVQQMQSAAEWFLVNHQILSR